MNKVIDDILVEATILGMISEADEREVKYRDKDGKMKTMKVPVALRMRDPKHPARIAAEKLKQGDDPGSKSGEEDPKARSKPTDDQSDDDFAKVGDDPTSGKSKKKEEETEELSPKDKKQINKINDSLPEAVRDADPSIARALHYGYRRVPSPPKKPVWVPAPGNASSLYNETVSMIGAEILKENPGMKKEELRKVLQDKLGGTAAWKDIKKADHIETTLNAAVNKYNMTKDAMIAADIDPQSAETKSYYGTNVSLKNQYDDIMNHTGPFYGGNGKEIKKIPTDTETRMFLNDFKDPDTGEKLSEKDIDNMLRNPKDPEVVKRFLALSAYNGGGGGNPSDTATIITDGDKMQFIAFSDKTSLADQQANSTPNQLLNNFYSTMKILEGEDYEFDPEQKKQIEDVIKKQGKSFIAAEKKLGQAQAAPFNVLAGLLSNPENKEVKNIFDDVYKPPNGKRYAPIKSVHSLLSQDPESLDDPKKIGWPNKAVGNKLKTMEEAGVKPLPTWGYYLEQAGWKKGQEVTPELAEAAYMARAGDSREYEDENGEPTSVGDALTPSDQQRYISEVIKGVRQAHRNPKNKFELEGDDATSILNQQKEIEKYRQESIDALNNMHDELNKFKIEKDGEDAGMGDVLMARDMARSLHLGMIDDNAPGLFSFGSVHIVAGEHRTSPEAMRECLGGVSDVDDLTRNTKTRPVEKSGPQLPGGLYESEVSRSSKEQVTNDDGQNLYIINGEYKWLSEPPKKSKDTTIQGPLGPITGRKVFAYTLDAKGNEIPIGEMSMRTKGGTTLQTTYTFARPLQKCLESKSGPTNESVTFIHIQTLLEMARQV